MFLHYIIFAIVVANSLGDKLHGKKYVAKRKTASAAGKYLRDHVYKITNEAIDPQHCIADCWADNDRCQSFNYFPNLDMCELNEASNLTNPEDLIDKPDTVYLTNPFYGRNPAPDVARHTKYANYAPPDACASNPCTNAASCVNDALLGYRCENCHSRYTGPKCDEHLDPCIPNPCHFGATCISTMTRWRCVCPFPFQGGRCTQVVEAYNFNLNGTGDYYPSAQTRSHAFSQFLLNFWFKTQQKMSYFVHKIPTKSSDTERLTVWHVGNTFFVELWKDHVYNFSFPLSNPVNDNNWHVVVISLKATAELLFYLDGARREPPKMTIGVPYSNNLYNFKESTLYIGYFKDSNDQEYFFNGSIGKVDIGETTATYESINNFIVRSCKRVRPYDRMWWWSMKWAGMDHHAKKVDYSERAPVGAKTSYSFPRFARGQWLDQAVSPPQDLTAFTMIFQILTRMFFSEPVQIACYGDQGDACHLSVVININYTLELIIESTRFMVDLLPINDNKVHYVAIRWTNDKGVFELIIDGVLQSTRTGIEANGKISGQSRFMICSIVSSKGSLEGHINNLNVWDKIISDDMLYLMILEPGNDVGNVVAWRDFGRPSSIPEEEFNIEKTNANFRVDIIGEYNITLEFSQPFPAYILPGVSCCPTRHALTVAMWLKLKHLPANLVRIKETNGFNIALNITENGNIQFFLKGEIASLGTWPNETSENNSDRNNNYLALSWSNSGDLFFNLNGNEKYFNFAQGSNYRIHRGGYWLIGEKQKYGTGIVGNISQLNIWHVAHSPQFLMMMSRGINAVGARELPWYYLIDKRRENVKIANGNVCYLPDFVVQKRRDQHCNDVLPPGCKYRARVGRFGELADMRWGCFCEENLSEDMNYNNVGGDYSQHVALLAVN